MVPGGVVSRGVVGSVAVGSAVIGSSVVGSAVVSSVVEDSVVNVLAVAVGVLGCGEDVLVLGPEVEVESGVVLWSVGVIVGIGVVVVS